jgi:hypothetical protein
MVTNLPEKVHPFLQKKNKAGFQGQVTKGSSRLVEQRLTQEQIFLVSKIHRDGLKPGYQTTIIRTRMFHFKTWSHKQLGPLIAHFKVLTIKI